MPTEVTESTALEAVALTKEGAEYLLRSWPHFKRYFEDVSQEDMVEDEYGKHPTKLVLTAEMRARYPDGVSILPHSSPAVTFKADKKFGMCTPPVTCSQSEQLS